MSEALSRLRLPLLLLSLALLVGGSKFDTLRPGEGQVVALLLALIDVVSGVGPFVDTIPTLRNAAFLLGAVVLGFTELSAYGAVFGDDHVPPPLSQLLVLLVCLLAAVLCEVAAAQRSVRVRCAAWLGVAIVFGCYFPGHTTAQNLFGSVFAAFLVALFVGGGGGLFLGELAVRRTRS